MDAEEFAKILMDEQRKSWQDPLAIIEQIGIQSGASIADLACGPGYFAMPLAEAAGEGGRVYAVDSNRVMIEILRSNIEKINPIVRPRLNVIQADVAATNIPAQSVHVVFFANILHDIQDKTAFFDEAKRISKPNEALFVDIDWHKRDMELGPPFDRRLSEGESRKILVDAGLPIVRVINAGPYHYGLVAKRTPS